MENMIINTIKEQVEHRIRELVDYENSHDNGYKYFWKSKEWNNYDKSRTYYSIIEVRESSNKTNIYEYGFIDNKTGKYTAGRLGTNDILKNYDLSGAKYEFKI